MIKTILPALILSAFTASSFAAEPWSLGGFDMPESALVDSREQRIILSNIGGHPGEVDGNGYLSLIGIDGALIEEHWVVGLDAPKGLALVGDALLVADLGRLHVIEAATGVIRQSIEVEDAQFLNDVTSDGDVAWITDLLDHTIWVYRDGEVTRWLHDPKLSHPNGILFDEGKLIVGAWGRGLREDFSTEVPGSLMKIDVETKAIADVTTGLGNLDGIARAGDSWIVSDWISGEVHVVDETGETRTLLLMRSGVADVSVHDGRLYLPMMLEGHLQAVDF